MVLSAVASFTASWLKKLVVLLFVFSFLASGVVLNVIQFFFLPLYCINRRLYRIINSKIVYFHWAIIPWAIQSWANYEIVYYAESEKCIKYMNVEHALVLLNHRGDVDWMIGWCLIEVTGMLGGTKAIMKDVAKFVPGIGWMFYFMEYPIVKRSWEKDQPTLAAACRNLADYPINMLLCLFAEGTRFTPEKHKVSMEVARKKGLPELKYHLLPRTRGFTFLVNHMKETIPTIYCVTFGYREGTPSIAGMVDRKKCVVDLCFRRFPMSAVPTDSEQATAAWLHKLYQEKDELVDYHTKHHRFPGKVIHLDRRPWPTLVMAFWLLMFGVPLFLFALYLMWIGSWTILMIIVVVLMIVNVIFSLLIRMTEIKHGSSQGLSTQKSTASQNGSTSFKQE